MFHTRTRTVRQCCDANRFVWQLKQRRNVAGSIVGPEF
jgi:hypothetical protein